MCCENAADDLLPPLVAEMLGRYRALLARHGEDWGRETGEGDEPWRDISRVMPFCDHARLHAAISARSETPEDAWQLVLHALPDPLPQGIAIAHRTGIDIAPRPPFLQAGGEIPYLVVIPGTGSAAPVLLETIVGSGHPYLKVGAHSVRAAEPVSSGRVRLTSDAVSRWSVVDERGGGWFPPQKLRKYDYHGRPYFHGNATVVDVPEGRCTVSVARGCEFRPVTVGVDINAGEETAVDLSPARLYDAASRGWYGADLHVHMNYSGDQVCTPNDAIAMQRGEDLHLMNLVAANARTGMIYDREALEVFAGRDLPWNEPGRVARLGVEYRNDLFGHFHALNPSVPPSRYNTGHILSNEPQDWPPNSVAASELRDHGATIGYTHPVMVPLGEGGSPAAVFDDAWATVGLRNYQARELVADAALGLIDSIDLTGHEGQNLEATEYLYHRLLGCGLHLAATAGTDVMLSRSRGLSNPPGWSRAYADLRGERLSVQAWQEAVRAGRTFATNGPWLELDVAGLGPGDTMAADGTVSVPVVARVVGIGVERLEIVGPLGPIAVQDVPSDAEQAELTTALELHEPLWLAAVARGGGHPAVLGPQVFAHTSPVWIDVSGRSIARAADARWCIDWLDRFERLARTHGNFTARFQLTDLVTVIEQARVFYQAIARDK